MSGIKELRTILYNHRKLISMISDDVLPIKSMLLKDVQDMNEAIEYSSTHRRDDRNGQSKKTL